MGLLGAIFSGLKGGSKSSRIVSGRNPGSKGWIEAARFNKARGGFAGGWGAIAFGNIVNAHSSADDIIDKFGLDQEDCPYIHPSYGMSPWMQAYREALQQAQMEAMMMNMFGVDVDPEDLIDWDQVEEDAYDYAEELAELYIDGQTWIPLEILEWAYYDVSDHNW